MPPHCSAALSTSAPVTLSRGPLIVVSRAANYIFPHYATASLPFPPPRRLAHPRTTRHLMAPTLSPFGGFEILPCPTSFVPCSERRTPGPSSPRTHGRSTRPSDRPESHIFQAGACDAFAVRFKNYRRLHALRENFLDKRTDTRSP